MMEIPFKKEIAAAYSKGLPIVEAFPEYKDSFNKLFISIQNITDKA